MQSCTCEQLKDGRPVILYGAAQYGELAYYALCAAGVPVFAFCDRVQAGKQFCGLDVLPPKQIREYPEAHVLICATKGFAGVSAYLESISHRRCYEISQILSSINYDTLPEYLKVLPLDEWVQKYRFFLPENNGEEQCLDLPFVSLGITLRCTLRCRKCSGMMPYYDHPQDFEFNDIIQPFQRFLSCVNSIAELQITGGEPLLHKDIDRILDWCLGQEKIKEISIITNGTIIPNENLCSRLINPKVRFLLDDYGAVSRKLPEIIQLCGQKGIRYLLQQFKRWDDLGDFHDRHETEERLAEKFRYCSFSNATCFARARLYRCGVASTIAHLCLIPDAPGDYVDFSADGDIKVWQEQIRGLFREKKYHQACRICNGAGISQEGIPVAEQISAEDVARLREEYRERARAVCG